MHDFFRVLIGATFIRIAACSVAKSYDHVQSHHLPRDLSGLEKRQAQYIVNPCPEFFGDERQYCSDCGGDSKEKGICDNVRLNGLQAPWCRAQGGCGVYCRCRPDMQYNGPSKVIQFISIFCPESYGLSMQKCSDPKCGGDVYYEGICDNILVSGAQGPGCPRGGCGISCKCDPSPGEDPPAPTATTIMLSGSESVLPTSHAPYPTTDLPSETTEIINTSGDPGPPTASLNAPSSSSSSSTAFSEPGTASMPASSGTSLVYITGPLPEPTPITTVAPAPTTSAGGIIIPIIPIPVPLPGFLPPPPLTPNPKQECGSPQDVQCPDCGGIDGWCQQPPNQGCMCQDPCTENEYQPDCGDEGICKGEDGICTIGSQKGCECKQGCAEDNDAPLCSDDDCKGEDEGKCTEAPIEGCDCFITLTNLIADDYDLSWGTFQQQMLSMLSAGVPGWEYTTMTDGLNISATTKGSSMSSSTFLAVTTSAANSSATVPASLIQLPTPSLSKLSSALTNMTAANVSATTYSPASMTTFSTAVNTASPQPGIDTATLAGVIDGIASLGSVASINSLASVSSLKAAAASASSTTSPPPTTAAVLTSSSLFPLACTLLDGFLPDGKVGPKEVHTCHCNDGSSPSATLSGTLYVCPAQVTAMLDYF